MGKRANREGSVYQRASDGKWCGAVTLPDRRRKIVYGDSQKAVLIKIRALQRLVTDGVALQPGRNMTLGAYLSFWTEEVLVPRVAAGRLAPATLASYRDQVRLHLVPDLGDVPLSQLSPVRLRTWLNMKLERPGHRGRPLSARSVAYLHAVLRASLSDAVRDELVSRNVCLLVAPPRASVSPGQALTADQVACLLSKAEGHRLRPLWVVLIALGLRKGEALALRWSDINLETGTVRVHRTLQRLRDGEPDHVTGRRRGRLVERSTTKTGEDAVLPLPDVVARELDRHRRLQVADRLAAKAWADPDLVFATRLGTPLEPRNVGRAWAALCVGSGIKPVRIHDLRHTAGSLLLEQGVDLKVVQRMLRHARLSTTADIYLHVSQRMERSAASKMDEIFRLMPGNL